MESYGGVNMSFSDGVLKPKNIISVDFYQQELTREELGRKNRYYIVQSGDNISKIANKFKVSEKTIIIENKIKSNLIKPGQELTVLPLSGVTHKVKKGDTILSLSKKYKVKEENIVDFNNLGGELKIGSTIVIPDGDKVIDISKKYIANYKLKRINTKTYKARKSSYRRYSGTSGYGYFTHPLPGSFRVRGITRKHKGVDMAAPIGTPILAAASGTVIKATNYG
jgi:LysM repeat protein